MKTTKNQQKTLGNGDGGVPVRHISLFQDVTSANEEAFVNRDEVKADSWKTKTMAYWWLGLNYLAEIALSFSCQQECGFYSGRLCKLQGNRDKKDYAANEVSGIKEYFNVMLGTQLQNKSKTTVYWNPQSSCIPWSTHVSSM